MNGIGIDFGSSAIQCVATNGAGQLTPIKSADNGVFFPAMVMLDPSNNQWTAGEEAYFACRSQEDRVAT